MKQQLNLDLIRKLLLELEGADEVDLSGHEQDEVIYHKYLILEAGFAKGDFLTGDDRIMAAHLELLTWKGQEFLADARNDTVWNHVKQNVAKKGGAVSLAIVQRLLSAAAQQYFGLP